ncbi:MAG: uridine kinase [Armatimonadetes bacterium]|nr:uridine kinase [Armatimonadota bacterium]MBS1703443.1 uridine kinase [Armatimonadota bacterium]
MRHLDNNHSNEHTNRPLVIGIAGGSGSGKTHLAYEIMERVGEENVLVLSMDQYFWSTDDPTADASLINFDHPQHLDFQLLIKHIRLLQEGKNIFAPGYDFRNMTRIWATEPTKPKPIIIVEGLFVLAQPVVSMCDLAVFLDVASDERLLGRILRDTRERSVTTEQVIDRYQRYVRPSYEIFVNPTKQNADMVVDFTFRRNMFASMLSHMLSDYLSKAITAEDLIYTLRGDRALLGIGKEEPYMPLTTNIEVLSKAYPEKVWPVETSRNHLSSPAFTEYRGIPTTATEPNSAVAV